MNRAQRRRQQEPMKDRTLNIKESDMNQRFAQAVAAETEKRLDMVIEEATSNSIAVVVKVLQDKYGFGPKKIQNFMKWYNEVFDAILNENETIEGLREEALKIGINLDTIEEDQDA